MTLLVEFFKQGLRVTEVFFFCGPGGDTEYLDDVEIFDGRRWKRANYKLDQVKKEKYFW